VAIAFGAKLLALHWIVDNILVPATMPNVGPASTTVMFDKLTLPVFVTLYVYDITSPASVIVGFAPALVLGADAVLSTTIDGVDVTGTFNVSGGDTTGGCPFGGVPVTVAMFLIVSLPIKALLMSV
jgi:hypothetical protein